MSDLGLVNTLAFIIWGMIPFTTDNGVSKEKDSKNTRDGQNAPTMGQVMNKWAKNCRWQDC